MEKGDKFPPVKDQPRISIQTRWEKLLHSKYIHNKIIDNTGKKVNIDPLVPIPASLSDISSDLLFGETPTFEFGNDNTNKTVSDWLQKYDFDTDMLESASYTSAIGTVFWHLFTIEGEVKYEFIPANLAYWEVDALGEITIITFYELIEYDKQRGIKSYQLTEHQVGSFRTYKIKVRDTDQEVKSTYDDTTSTTDLDFIPVIKILNIGQLRSQSGRSDYQGKEQMFAEIDNRVDQINYILQEHADPWTFVPPGVLNQSGWFNRNQGKMVEKAPAAAGGENSVDVIAWDGQLASAFQQIETMIYLIFFTSRISAPIAGLDKGGNVESGRALKWRSINTLSMINRKRKYFNKALQKFFWMANQMDSGLTLSDDELKMFQTAWKDGLPTDYAERVDSIVKQTQNGLLSKLSGIQDINEVSAEEAQEELDQVNKEQQQQADIDATANTITL